LIDAARQAADNEFSADHLIRRLQQFHDETYIFVPAAAQAIAKLDLAAFGAIAANSQRGAERALENQIAETIGLVTLAHEHGAIAASAFGAGFGGSVWALVHESIVDDFQRNWRESYVSAFPATAQRAQVFATSPSPAAFEIAGG
jgi:galactokinase